MSGDPGRRRGFFRHAFKAPRFIRKFQPGRFAAPLARLGAGLLPGGGALMTAADLAGFTGDPGPRRGKSAKRKSAGAGTRHKAANKRKARAAKGGGIGAALSKLDYGKLGEAAVGAIPFIGAGAQELAAQLRAGGGTSEALDASLPGMSQVITPSGDLGLVPHGTKHRMPTLVHRRIDSWMRRPGRAMNFANVKALRKGVRRIEGFERIVKSVHRAYPRLARAHAAPHRFAPKRGRK